MQAREIAVDIERRRQQSLREIDAALKRIETGHYGKCSKCGEEIDPRRLRLEPTARYCVDYLQAEGKPQ